jgi:CBS-domain-containing membrane protein
MTSPVHTIWQNASVESAVELMTAKSVTALPVVDRAGLLVGMVGEAICCGTGYRPNRRPAPATCRTPTPATGPAWWWRSCRRIR